MQDVLILGGTSFRGRLFEKDAFLLLLFIKVGTLLRIGAFKQAFMVYLSCLLLLLLDSTYN